MRLVKLPVICTMMNEFLVVASFEFGLPLYIMVKNRSNVVQQFVCTLIDNDILHHSGQNLLWTHLVVHSILNTVMTSVVDGRYN